MRFCDACENDSGYAADPNYTGQAQLMLPCRKCHADWWREHEGKLLNEVKVFPPKRKPEPTRAPEIDDPNSGVLGQAEGAPISLPKEK